MLSYIVAYGGKKLAEEIWLTNVLIMLVGSDRLTDLLQHRAALLKRHNLHGKLRKTVKQHLGCAETTLEMRHDISE